MKSKNAFTLVELLVVVVIIAIGASIVVSSVHHSSDGTVTYDPMMYPEEAKAQAAQRLVRAQEEANALKREELQLIKNKQLEAR